MATKKDTANAVKEEKKIMHEVNPDPPLPPFEDIIVNLGFWIAMAQKASQMIVKNKLSKDVLSESDTDKKS